MNTNFLKDFFKSRNFKVAVFSLGMMLGNGILSDLLWSQESTKEKVVDLENLSEQVVKEIPLSEISEVIFKEGVKVKTHELQFKFKQTNKFVVGSVESLEFDPNQTRKTVDIESIKVSEVGLKKIQDLIQKHGMSNKEPIERNIRIDAKQPID